IDLDQRHLLFAEPGQHIEGHGAAAVQHDDSRRKVRIALEEAIVLLFLRVVSKAVANYQGAGLDAKRDAMSGEGHRQSRSCVPYSPRGRPLKATQPDLASGIPDAPWSAHWLRRPSATNR